LKAARGDNGDGDAGVALLEGAILGTGGADQVGDGPAVALGEQAPGWAPGGAIRPALSGSRS